MRVKKMIAIMALSMMMCGCGTAQAAETGQAKETETVLETMETKLPGIEQTKEAVPEINVNTRFTAEQKKALEGYWNELLNNVHADGTVEVSIPASSGVTTKDLITYMNSYNLGEGFGGSTIKVYTKSSGTRLTATVNPQLKAQNDTVKAYVEQITEGMTADLASVKSLYEKMVTGFSYERHEVFGANVLLETGSGKCCDFTSLYSAALTKLGIENYCVTGVSLNPDGTEGAHTWNGFVLNGTCYTVDITDGIAYKKAGADIWHGFKESEPTFTPDNTYRADQIV